MEHEERPLAERVSFNEALRYWIRLGFINFGGPAGQIAIMHEDLVERRRWIDEERFLHALNFCMLLPGPEATQLAIYVGWLLNGTWGGIVAGIFFVLPAFFLILFLSWSFAVYGDISWVEAVFYGLRCAVVAIVAAALIRIGSKALRNKPLTAIAIGAFVGIFFLHVPFPLIIAVAAVTGVVGSRFAPDAFAAQTEETEELGAGDPEERLPTRGRNLRVLAVGLALWWIPVLAVMAWRGPDDTLSEIGLFFSQAAMVTFGGAYAVLSYVNQVAVDVYGWLEPGQMVTGLGLAESTPGPLIMVTEFVGFLGAYRFPGGLDPVLAGTLGAALTVWVTFVPCFLWILLGGPYIERLRGNPTVYAALTAVTAAVVGVVANLAVAFSFAVLFETVRIESLLGTNFPAPDLTTIDPFAALLAAAGFVALWRFRVSVLWIVGGGALAGLVYRQLT